MNPRPAERLSAMLTDATETMQRLSGGAALCTFTRLGQPVPGIKYAEGRWAALRETQRLLAAGHELSDAAARVAESWQMALARAGDQRASRDWIAYRSGGIDALDELATQVSPSLTSATPPSSSSAPTPWVGVGT